eukprot:CAMPEP_0197541488 /NCGR_PEP_ID=MMETSP1318-20131121/67186_1 /TAXON_ID=552666 /ORGANISM="Partenskyella glossopodia, Strain RCC365" /LENGTH=122 /DNA_ID=CAMNT_0043100665 /DNA_START=180 /DNA_END=548 /DNA_ORIENTATION=+
MMGNRNGLQGLEEFHARCKSGDLRGAKQILHELNQNGVKSDVRSYNGLINACAKSGNVAAAERLLQEMGKMGSEPDVVTFSSLIDAYTKAEQPDVKPILEFMNARGLKPDEVTMKLAFGLPV